MRTDALRVSATYAIALLILIGGFYALVLYELQLDDLVKGAIIGFMSAAISFVFTQETAKTTATATTKALMAPVPPGVILEGDGPIEGTP